jgi:ketosteroid isomerase-like protein
VSAPLPAELRSAGRSVARDTARAMSQENVETIREMVAASQRGDWAAAIAPFDPDVELDQTRMPGGGIYHGVDGVWSFYRRWFGSWENIKVRPQRVLEVDADRVLSLLEVSGTGRESGAEVSMTTADLYTIREGRIVRAIGYPDQREAVEAAGLSE